MSRSGNITQRMDGDSWKENTAHIARWFCCDCGLAHDIEFKVKSKRTIVVSCKRNERATATRRRYKDFKCKPSENWTEELK